MATATDGATGPLTLLSIAAAISAAKLGAEAAARVRLPAVVGELLAGVLLGTVTTLMHVDWLDPRGAGLGLAAELGAVFLLFKVGIESDVAALRRVGVAASLVALIGVVVPSAAGVGVAYLLDRHASLGTLLFLGAALAATSVGVTASVLADAGALGSREARVVLGAAVLDDLLGLVVLAVVSGVAQGGKVGAEQARGAALVAGKAFVLLAGGYLGGRLLAGRVLRVASKMAASGVLAAMSAAFCLFFAALAGLADLAPIVGAFAAGLLLDEVAVVRHFGERAERLEDIFRPIVALFTPIFFVRMGMLIDVSAVANAKTLLLALALTVVAVAGKVVAGVASGAGSDRVLVGVAMIPRGEVGLIFAQVGAGLVVEGRPILGAGAFGAVVLMVLATTLVGPTLLRWRLARAALPGTGGGDASIAGD